jgi:hypothetical protein
MLVNYETRWKKKLKKEQLQIKHSVKMDSKHNKLEKWKKKKEKDFFDDKKSSQP